MFCVAGPAPTGNDESDFTLEKTALVNDRYQKGTWDWSLEVAYMFNVVANWYHCMIDMHAYDANVNPYEFVTQTVGVRYRLNGVKGRPFLTVSTQLCADIVVTEIVAGPESYFVGGAVGMHFDFVQRSLPVVPYMDFRGGPGGIDAAKGDHGQQSHFEFTYLWGAGLRYDINSSISLSVGAEDQHFSDAGLVRRNVSVDNLGVNIRLEKKF